MTICVCFKCKSEFESDNKDDIAGDGYCPACFALKAEVIKKAEAILAKIRTEKQKLIIPKVDFSKVSMNNPIRMSDLR